MKNIFAVLAVVLILGACSSSTPEPTTQILAEDIVFEQPQGMQAADVDIASIFSNENVVVFPVTGPISDNMEQLNRYRGVLDNTTAGGYTVFDPSVTVFAVGRDQMQKPSYLPDYSVPQHAAQYKSIDQMFPPAPEPFMPQPVGSNMPQSILSMPLEPKAETTPTPVPLSQQTGRRSSPMLTGY